MYCVLCRSVCTSKIDCQNVCTWTSLPCHQLTTSSRHKTTCVAWDPRPINAAPTTNPSIVSLPDVSRSTRHKNLQFLTCYDKKITLATSLQGSQLHNCRFAISEFASPKFATLKFAVSEFVASTQTVVLKAPHVMSVEHVFRQIPSSTSRSVPQYFCCHRLRADVCRVALGLLFLCAILVGVNHHVLCAQQRRSPFDRCA